jgi:hypothetical protein
LAIRRKLRRALIGADDANVTQDLFSCCLKAAVVKCLDFNDAAHSKNQKASDGYLFVSGMRGICEDLIVLRFLAQIGQVDRNEFLSALLQKNWWDGISAQARFFRENNSLQPFVGGGVTDEEINASVAASNQLVVTAALKIGFDRKPTVAAMARTVGLLTTYEFIYFLTSNFVHFNPQALMRMGWGKFDKKAGRKRLRSISFSTSHMGGYYNNLAKFYGTVLLVGFLRLLRGISEFDAIDLDKELSQIEDAMAALGRWPEVVTFEEMNIRPPLFLLFRAMREVMRSEGEPIKYGQILEELKFGTEVRPAR